MSRPLRIEYEGAWYHVMNRGAGRRDVFLHDTHRAMYLELLGELLDRFGVETHAYCLMSNHYHNLMHTPQGNLSRAMRHLDGVYTQRFNRLEKTDGPLFRGRYKSIVVEADSYLLQLSRYIHRNPLEAHMVDQLEDYRWSSYPAYIGKRRPAPWLQQDQVLETLGGQHARYRQFVEQGSTDPGLKKFYRQPTLSPILGSRTFADTVLSFGKAPLLERKASLRRVQEPVSCERLESAIATVMSCQTSALHVAVRGRLNLPRLMALYLGQQLGRQSLKSLAQRYGIGHYGSVSTSIGRYRKLLKQDKRLAAKNRRVVEIVKDET